MLTAEHFISSHCRLVKGAKGSAIYDLLNGRVYSLNADAVKAITTPAEEIEPQVADYLRHLKDLELIDHLDHGTFSEYENPGVGLRYIWLELTNRCNCRCLHCYGDFGHPSPADLMPELPYDDWAAIVEKIARLGGTSIQLIGSEPLLFPRFGELLMLAHHLGINNIDIFTNGFFMTRELVSICKEVGASVRVSLYGYDSVSHEKITQTPGSFHRLDRCLDDLREAGVPTRIAVVLMRENQDDLPSIIRYISQKGQQYTGYDVYRQSDPCAGRNHVVTNRTVLKERYMTRPYFHTSPEDFFRNMGWNSCWSGKFAVTAVGDIIPCIFARHSVCGNILRDADEDILSNLKKKWAFSKDHVEVCKDCEYRYACDDCRPLAVGETGVDIAKYPRCLYNPYTMQWGSLPE